MKKVMKKWKQTLSVLLAVAMAVTLLPQTGVSALAAEPNTVQTVTEGAAVEESTADDGITGEPAVDKPDTGDDTGEGTAVDEPDTGDDAGEGTTVDEPDTGDDAGEEPAADDPDADDGVTEEPSGDGTASDEAEDIPTKGNALFSEDVEEIVEETSCAVSVAYLLDGSSYEDETPIATVAYTNGCVATDEEGNDTIVADTDLTFTVTPENGYEISTVAYKIGTATTSTGVTPDTEGIYTIKASEITGNITIDVAVVKPYTVSFSVTGAKVKIGDAVATASPVGQSVREGEELTFSVEPDEGNKIRYVNTTDSAEGAIAANEDGSYTFTPSEDNTTDKAATIYVNATELQDIAVNFTFDDANVEVQQVTDGSSAKELTALGEGNKISAKEDDVIQFIAEAKEDSKHSVTEVAVGSTPLSKSTEATSISGKDYYVYTLDLTDVAENVTVTVTSELDEDKANVATLSVNGNSAGFTATVIGNDTYQDTYKAGDDFVTEETSLTFDIRPAANFEIEKVEAIYTADGATAATTEEITPNKENGYYVVDFTGTARLVEVRVSVGGAAIEEENTIIFNNTSDNMSYEVTTNENVKKVDGKTNTYTLAEGTKNVEFTVTAKGNFAPVVTVNGEKQEGIAGEPTTVKGVKSTPYSYTVAAGALTDNNIVVIGEAPETKTVSVQYDDSEVTVSAKLAGKEVQPDAPDEEEEPEDGVAVYTVNTDSSLVLVVTPLANCELTGAATQVGTEASKNATIKATGGEITVKATDNATVAISSEGLYTTALLDKNGEAFTAVKNVYTVAYYDILTTKATKGVDTPVALSKVEITDSKKKPVQSFAEIAEDKASAALAIIEEDAGKKLTVILYTAVEEEDVAIGSYTLNVLPALTGITVKGVTNGAVTQTVDTVAEYALTATPKTADLSVLGAEVSAAKENASNDENTAAQAAVQATISDGKLVITTASASAAAEAVAKVSIIDKTVDTNAPEYETGSNVITSIVVNTAVPAALQNATPGVKVKSSDDVSLTLTLSAPKTVVKPNAGQVYYKVEAAPQTVEETTTPEGITNATTNAFYIAKDAGATSQDAKITVNNAGLGNGQAWKFDLKVTLVQTGDGEALTAGNAEEKVLFNSKTKEFKNAATKAPYYETKLSLKKGTTTVYTGQTDVQVATAQFTKNTTFTGDLTASVTYGDGWSVYGITADVDGDVIKVTAEKYAEPGNYTVTVTAKAPANTYQTSASITINVVQGIYRLSLDQIATSLYKADKKAATLKVTPVYTGNYTTPKTKKVTYEILNYSGQVLSESDRLYGYVTVKNNGTVTVNKNYVLSTNPAENTFRVRATAADFKGNDAYADLFIIITSEAVQLSEVCIVREVWDEGTYSYAYEVVTRGNETVTSGELEGTCAVAFEKGTPEKDVYTLKDIQKYASAQVVYGNVTFKSGNKALSIDPHGAIYGVSKTAKNITITATANDGGKSSAVLKNLTIGYAAPAELGLQVLRQDDYQYDGDFYEISEIDEKDVQFTGTTNTVLELDVYQKAAEDSEWDSITELTNYSVTVKNATVLTKDSLGNPEKIIANKETATVTLKDKTSGVSKTYTIRNTGYSNAAAPKVKTSGSLVAGYYGSDQTITCQLSGSYDWKDKYVMIKTDAASAAKEYDAYDDFDDYGQNINGYMPVNEDGTFDLYFNSPYTWGGNRTNIPAGSYKLQFTFGTVDADGNFVPDTKAVAVTLKAVAPKSAKTSYKPVTSVKLSVKDKAGVTLAGTGKNFDHEYYYDLLNANLDGNANAFLTYFELDSKYDDVTDTYTNKLQLKSGLSEGQIAYITGPDGKNDRIGYVSYEYEDSNRDCISGTTKLTVTFTDTVSKYAVSSEPVLKDETMTATVKVTAAKQAAVVADAYADGEFAVEAVNGSEITLTSTTAAVGKNTVTLYLVPEDSYYAGKVAELKAAIASAPEEQKAAATAAYEEAIKAYGVKATATITVKDKATTTGKIKIAKSDLTKKFTAENYVNGDQNYFIHVPYTKTVPCEIQDIASDNESNKGLIYFGWFTDEEEGDVIDISVNKAALQEAVAAGTVSYGDQLTVKATVGFGEGTADEEFTFKVTLPAKAEMTYDEAVAAVKAAQAEIEEAVVPNYRKGISDADIIYSQAEAIEQVGEKVDEIVPGDSDTEIVLTQWEDLEEGEKDPTTGEPWSLNIAGEDFSAPTSKEAGKLVVRIELKNTEPAETPATTEVAFTLTIPATGEEPNDVKDAVLKFISDMQTGYVTNETTYEDVVNDAREAVLGKEYTGTLRLSIDDFKINEATDAKDGSITGSIHVWGIKYGGEEVSEEFTFTIPRLEQP